MQLASVRIFVTDLEATARFYRDVVGLTESFRSDDVAVFGDDYPMVVVEQADKEAHDEKLVGRFTGVSFATDDASVLHKSLIERGVTTDGPPEKQPWGGILLHARDPSNNTITFLQVE
jgi:predicted enzyme related to lactoylglutathione lyase